VFIAAHWQTWNAKLKTSVITRGRFSRGIRVTQLNRRPKLGHPDALYRAPGDDEGKLGRPDAHPVKPGGSRTGR